MSKYYVLFGDDIIDVECKLIRKTCSCALRINERERIFFINKLTNFMIKDILKDSKTKSDNIYVIKDIINDVLDLGNDIVFDTLEEAERALKVFSVKEIIE